MVLNAAVQMLRDADELKQNILRFKSGTSMLQDRNLWTTQQQLQQAYQKILILDLDYALEKKVEQDLWNVGFKQQIEALQAISKDKKSPLRSDAQAMLSWVLQAAAGFYLCLLHQICTTFKLDLPFRRRASLLGAVEGWEAGPGGAPPATVSGGAGAARYASQHCLVHLGDLARYRQQLRLAHTFYRHALAVSPHSGQPYNQLALVWWRRGRRLCAVYGHVRSLLVRAPFPPAPANLARTLRAAAAANTNNNCEKESALPVLGSVDRSVPTRMATAERIDAHSYTDELLRALHYIHSLEQLDTATSLVENLNWSLTPLIATDSFDSMTLIKMSCVIIWAVQSCTEEFLLKASALSADEATAARLATSLAASHVLALLLPAYTSDEPPRRALPALKVWLQWVSQQPALLSSEAWRARPQLWPALAHALSALAPAAHALRTDQYDTVPLPEDEELQGFLPLEEGFKGLKFASRAAWDAYSVPELDANDDDTGPPADPWSACREPEREHRMRARRLLALAARLAAQQPQHLACHVDEDGRMTFEASTLGGEQLIAAELNTVNIATIPSPSTTVTTSADTTATATTTSATTTAADTTATTTATDAPDTPTTSTGLVILTGAPPAPVVISEADFREKVREKRVGILKPQGSLERAREERALQGAQPPPEGEVSDDSAKSEEKKETRKPRVNIAMAAIMRKQEETNKQVKFVTPPPSTPDSTADSTETPTKEAEKPKVIQPKPVKSLANLPVGRKTGGILSLKDKSAGYPHLVNVEPEPKKLDKEEKTDSKPNQSTQNLTNQKRQEQPGSQGWANNVSPQNYTDPTRMNFQKNYGIQSAGIGYNPSYPAAPSPNSQGIKLPVVNPKEIDVRTAALQKQNSRQEMFQEPHKFANQNYQISGDKINFLNDLPPRFANQYRYWHASQDNQFNENKFRDDSFKASPGYSAQVPRPGWSATQTDGFQQPSPWWKPDNPPLFNPSYTNLQMNVQAVPNYYSAVPSNVPNPYRNLQYNQLATQNPNAQGLGQSKPENLGSNYLQTAVGPPQLQTLQNLVTSPSYNSSLSNFSYTSAVPYDSSMYPQFSNKLGYPPLQMKMLDKPAFQGDKSVDMGLNFGANLSNAQPRTLNYNEPFTPATGGGATTDSTGVGVAGGGASGAGGGAYSLFSGAAAPAWAGPRAASQSLWSGSQSPLERLLEQQKQMQPQ
ncbi:uncharacterized protein [Epargyreus clarus]|uniref:uncharacterized protein n=1 Tax=Epargyreus clarus TaxID=520877 RepID=UPI003C2ECA92